MQTKPKLHQAIRNLVFSAVCLALCLVLPFFTGQIPQIGGMLCPMHIPVFLAGFLCGPWWAMIIGLITPTLRYALFSMPPLMPTGITMTFELAVYGMTAGLLYRILPKKRRFVYLSLFGAMLAGRFVWGIASIFVFGAMGSVFSWPIFFAGAFINAMPGIILHVTLIPVLVLAMEKSGII